jgi:hypothetical protein
LLGKVLYLPERTWLIENVARLWPFLLTLRQQLDQRNTFGRVIVRFFTILREQLKSVSQLSQDTPVLAEICFVLCKSLIYLIESPSFRIDTIVSNALCRTIMDLVTIGSEVSTVQEIYEEEFFNLGKNFVDQARLAELPHDLLVGERLLKSLCITD